MFILELTGGGSADPAITLLAQKEEKPEASTLCALLYYYVNQSCFTCESILMHSVNHF